MSNPLTAMRGFPAPLMKSHDGDVSSGPLPFVRKPLATNVGKELPGAGATMAGLFLGADGTIKLDMEAVTLGHPRYSEALGMMEALGAALRV
jgi:hypothetical protein